MYEPLRSLNEDTSQKLYSVKADFDIERTDEQYGDFASNIAMQLAPKLKKSPKELAEQISSKLADNTAMFNKVEVAGPGFINFSLSNQALIDLAQDSDEKELKGQLIVVEFSDPNPFKTLHAGHLYTSVIGESIARLLEEAGANVKRINFGGDVGLHVAKCIWSIIEKLGGEKPEKLTEIKEQERADWLSARYVEGTDAYESNETDKEAIRSLNGRVYKIVTEDDHQSDLAKIYWTCRQWSYDYFDDFYKRLSIKFDKNYPESEVADLGLKIVRDHIPAVYTESQGAVIFDAQKYGLYSNVFINNQGLPTYGAKDV